jgi:hypothetical protein
LRVDHLLNATLRAHHRRYVEGGALGDEYTASIAFGHQQVVAAAVSGYSDGLYHAND